MRVRGAATRESCQFPDEFSIDVFNYACQSSTGPVTFGWTFSPLPPTQWELRVFCNEVDFDETYFLDGVEEGKDVEIPGQGSSDQVEAFLYALDSCGVRRVSAHILPFTCE